METLTELMSFLAQEDDFQSKDFNTYLTKVQTHISINYGDFAFRFFEPFRHNWKDLSVSERYTILQTYLLAETRNSLEDMTLADSNKIYCHICEEQINIDNVIKLHEQATCETCYDVYQDGVKDEALDEIACIKEALNDKHGIFKATDIFDAIIAHSEMVKDS